jgi:uncharacterized protein (DUF1501 family)
MGLSLFEIIHVSLFPTAGWGGNYFMFGGDVKGGVIKGDYPKSFLPSDPTNIGRGRLLPTTSWDALFYGLTQWMGISDQSEIDVSSNAFLYTRLDFSTHSLSFCPPFL